ncbi:MAG TPA: hypothetical protein DCR93_25790 [Cytophagales bacterium]|nr:hypothetical protein [Cytophagales bacterium]
MRHFLLLGLSLLLALPLQAQSSLQPLLATGTYTYAEASAFAQPATTVGTAQRRPKLWFATFLCASAGLIGIHRLYLGTSAETFFFYLGTAGGFGMLWFTDFILLLGADVSGNFDNYIGNRRILMFLDKDKGKR